VSYSKLYDAVQDGDCLKDAIGYTICDVSIGKRIQDLSDLHIVHYRSSYLQPGIALFVKIESEVTLTLGDKTGKSFGLVFTPRRSPDQSISEFNRAERLLYVKECMHALESGADTYNATDLRDLVREVVQRLGAINPQISNDFAGEYLALGVLCREQDRQRYIELIRADSQDYPYDFEVIAE